MKIKKHFKIFHTWIDLTALALLWVFYFLITKYSHVEYFSIVIKVLTLVATLEFLSFLFFHFFSNKKNLLLQSFIGGFISSTTTFVRLTNINLKNKDSNLIMIGLLSAFIAMLIECLLIYFTFWGLKNIVILIPIIIQLLILFMILLNYLKNSESKLDFSLSNEHPILWKKVLTLASFIIFLIISMRFIGNLIQDLNYLVTILFSLFEAHGVFAASISRLSVSNTRQIALEVMLILSGNFISKSFLVYKNNSFSLRSKAVIYFFLSIVGSWLSYFTFLWLNLI